MLTASLGCLPLALYMAILSLSSPVPLKVYLSSPKRPKKSPQPTFMAILSPSLALWASGPQAYLSLSVFIVSWKKNSVANSRIMNIKMC